MTESKSTAQEVQPELFVPGAKEFEVELALSGIILTVPSDRSMLSVIREAVPNVLSFCENGNCGTCATGVLGGEPEHHDSILSDQDRLVGDVVMICVGRSKTPRLVLDM